METEPNIECVVQGYRRIEVEFLQFEVLRLMLEYTAGIGCQHRSGQIEFQIAVRIAVIPLHTLDEYRTVAVVVEQVKVLRN